jgi:hypothetical protein
MVQMSRKPQKEDNLPITRTNKKEKIIGIVLFIVTILSFWDLQNV